MYPQKSAKYESLDSISRLKSNRLPEENHPNKNYISDWYKNTDILREKFMERLQIGDLLEFERGRYKHWAVYVGPGKIHDHEVVHLRNWGRTSRWFSKGSASRQSQNAIGKLVQCNACICPALEGFEVVDCLLW
ncbi:hypothetical protein QYM36_000122 [Artemia franciscana]|uniref:LRAT domain-containing protein n=1 Tax=Artemia franciscana TaxID=6661 RepID=A0AA88LG41_ARTSF|nr:hypothetical protein QYM36_000122 [Artemia franciscana]